MLLILILGLLLAAATPFIFRWLKHGAGVVISVFSFILFGYFCTFVPEILNGDNVQESSTWIKTMGVSLSFLIDGLSLFFLLLITFFGGLIFLYASDYMRGDPKAGRFFAFLTLFMVAMIGLVLSDDLVVLFVFWELTSISSYMLIGHDHDKEEARIAAQQALLMTAGGGLVMMAGFILAGSIGGWSISALLTQGDVLRDSAMYLPILLLILIGAFTKSAQFPFHFWLPNAMAAPTPVSAFLHSATMVKAGIYLLARFSPVLGGTEEWTVILSSIGAITMLLGGILAIIQTDIKKMLAYITVSALGILVLMLGIGSEGAVTACIVFLLAHALYKGALFLVAGNISHATHTKLLSKLGGLRRHLPGTAIASGLAALSLAGAPPLIGFIGKELLYEGVLGSANLPNFMVAMVVLTGMLFVGLAVELGYGIFFGKLRTEGEIHKISWRLVWPPLVLAFTGIVFGLFAAQLPEQLLNRTAESIIGVPVSFELYLFHGFNLSLLLSAITLAGGIGIYFIIPWIRIKAAKYGRIYRAGPESLYSFLLRSLESFARAQTIFLQNGRLRRYIGVIICTFAFLVSYTFFERQLSLNFNFILPLNRFELVFEILVAIFVLLGIAQVARTRSRLTLLISMSLMGFGIAVIFIIFSAPDVGITQILVETLTMVLFIMILHKLPKYRVFKNERRNWVYLLISVMFGALMTFLLLLLSGYSIESELKKFYLENSLPLAKGENVVNVILVDFRGFDTLGEISVLAIAAIGIAALLGLNYTKEGEL